MLIGASGPVAVRSVSLTPSLTGSLPSRKPACLTQVRHFWSASLEPQQAEKMTDPAPPDSTAVPDGVVVVDPTAGNGQCQQENTQQPEHQPEQQPNTGSQGEGFKMDQEMKITDSIDDQGRRWKFKMPGRHGALFSFVMTIYPFNFTICFTLVQPVLRLEVLWMREWVAWEQTGSHLNRSRCSIS